MGESLARSRAEWFVPHSTTILLPDGSYLTVNGIPYEGWGTAPGKIYRLTTHGDDGEIISERSWAVPFKDGGCLPCGSADIRLASRSA